MPTMTLRGCAAWFVVAVIAPPLLAGALLVQRSARAAETDALAHVGDAVDDAQAAYDTTAARLADQAQILADRNAAEQVTTDRPAPARRWVRAELDEPRAIGRADFAVLVRRDRTPLASAVVDDAVDVASVSRRSRTPSPASRHPASCCTRGRCGRRVASLCGSSRAG